MHNGAGDRQLAQYGELMAQSEGRITLRIPKAETAAVTGRLLAELDVSDLTVQDPPIEDVIEHVFSQSPNPLDAPDSQKEQSE